MLQKFVGYHGYWIYGFNGYAQAACGGIATGEDSTKCAEAETSGYFLSEKFYLCAGKRNKQEKQNGK